MPRGKPGSWEHGTVSGYSRCRAKYGTACHACKDAHADYNRDHPGNRGSGRGGLSGKIDRENRPPAPRHYAEGSTLEELLGEP